MAAKDIITKYKYIIEYRVNGRKEAVGVKTDSEKNRIVKMIKESQKPDSGIKNKYTLLSVKKVAVELIKIKTKL